MVVRFLPCLDSPSVLSNFLPSETVIGAPSVILLPRRLWFWIGTLYVPLF